MPRPLRRRLMARPRSVALYASSSMVGTSCRSWATIVGIGPMSPWLDIGTNRRECQAGQTRWSGGRDDSPGDGRTWDEPDGQPVAVLLLGRGQEPVAADL